MHTYAHIMYVYAYLCIIMHAYLYIHYAYICTHYVYSCIFMHSDACKRIIPYAHICTHYVYVSNVCILLHGWCICLYRCCTIHHVIIIYGEASMYDSDYMHSLCILTVLIYSSASQMHSYKIIMQNYAHIINIYAYGCIGMHVCL